MASIYESMREFTQHKIGRREFLKRAVAAGLATPAVIAFLEGCAPTTVSQSGGEAGRKVDLSKFTQDEAKINGTIG